MLTTSGIILGAILSTFLLSTILFRSNILSVIKVKGLVVNIVYFVIMVGISLPISLYLQHFLASSSIQLTPHKLNENEIKKSLISYLQDNNHSGTLKVRVSFPREVQNNENFELLMTYSTNEGNKTQVGIYFIGTENSESNIILKKYKQNISDTGYFPTAAGSTFENYVLKL